MGTTVRPISKEEADEFRELYPPRMRVTDPRCTSSASLGDAILRHSFVSDRVQCSRPPGHPGAHLVASMAGNERDPSAYWVRD